MVQRRLLGQLLLPVFIFTVLCQIGAAVIEQVDDSDLIHMLTGEDNVIVLFSKYLPTLLPT